MGRVNGHTVEQVIESVHKCHGLLAAVARDLSISRQTAYRYTKNYPTVAAAVHDEREEMIDIAEKGLVQAVQRGNIVAIMFLLKTIGKERGYVDRQEVTGADGGPVTIKTIEVVLPPEDTGDVSD